MAESAGTVPVSVWGRGPAKAPCGVILHLSSLEPKTSKAGRDEKDRRESAEYTTGAGVGPGKKLT